MAVTAASIIARAPDLASLDEDVIDLCIAEAEATIESENWSAARYELAVTYYAAHLATLASMGGAAAGAVTSMSAGAMSRSFAAPASTDGPCSTTAWGRLYINLCAGNLNFLTPISLG